MSTKSNTAAALSRQEVVITRVFDAPRDLVFKAWTEPERVKRWWGPKAFTTPFCEIDLRPGGVFRYCMRSPDGDEFWGGGVYREIVAPERIVYTDTFTDANGTPVPPSHYGMSSDEVAESLVTLIFTAEAGKTKVTMWYTATDHTDAEREMAQAGWNEMLDRLAEDLAQG